MMRYTTLEKLRPLGTLMKSGSVIVMTVAHGFA